MSLLNEIKQQAKTSGNALANIFFVKDGDKKRVRFLTDFEDGVAIPWLNDFNRNINCPNPEFFGKENPYADDEDVRQDEKNVMYMWQVYDYDSNSVKPFLYKANNCSPVMNLAAYYETNGTILDRDYIIQCTGSGTNRTMPVLAMDKNKFKQSIKKLSKQQIKKLLEEVYSKQFQGEADEEDSDNYVDMTAKELYQLCKERGLEVETKKQKPYYVEILEADDMDRNTVNGYTDEPDSDNWEEETEVDYTTMKAVDLWHLCKDKGIDAEARQKKQYYIDLLESQEEWDDEADEEDSDDWEDMPLEELPWN